MLCPLTGRRKPGGSQYYTVLLKLNDYAVPGSDHADVNALDLMTTTSIDYIQYLHYVLASSTQAQFQARHWETGVVGLSILLGLQPSHILGILEYFSSELMHLIGANMSSLWLDLFRGTIECAWSDDRATWFWAVLKENNAWQVHGQAVANCKSFLPGSFDLSFAILT